MTRAVELDPEKACFHSDLGQALAGLGRWEEAIAAHETARRLDPHCALVYYNLGATLAAQGKLSEAAAACCRVLSLKPDYAEAHNDLGLVLVRQGNLEAAKACYQAAIYFRPDYAEAHDNLGLILFSLGNVDEAVLAYREAVRLKPGFAKAHNDLAIALADRGELVEAVVHYEVALRLEPEAAYAHANLAGLLIEQGLLDEDPEQILTEVAQRCCQFQVRVVAADGGGNGHVYNRMLVGKLAYGTPVYAILYSTTDHPPQQDGALWKWTVNRSATIGTLFSRVKKKMILFPRLVDCGSYLDEIGCELTDYDDYHRTIKYTHPETQPDDALHATNYSLVGATRGWSGNQQAWGPPRRRSLPNPTLDWHLPALSESGWPPTPSGPPTGQGRFGHLRV